MKSIFRLISFAILFLLGLNVFSQYTARQADSLLNNLHENPHINRIDAIHVCNELILSYGSLSDSCKMIAVLIKRAYFENQSAKPEQSMATLIEAQKLYDASNCSEELQISIYYNYNRIYSALNLQEKADSIALLGINMFKPAFANKSMLIYLYVAASEGFNKPIDEALPYLDTALRLSVEYQLPELEKKVLQGIGALYGNNENYVEAEKYMQMALQIAIKQKSYDELSSIYNNLAGLADSDDEVLVYIDSALYYARLSKNLRDIQLYTENKAYFFSTIGEFEKGYNTLWKSMLLKDTLINIQQIEAIADLEHKYEAEKRLNEIQALKVENLNTEVENLMYKRTQNGLLIGSAFLLMLAVFFAYNFLSTRKNRDKLAKKNIEIEKARQLSDELLLNILPSEIALELKEKGQAEARKFDRVSILFTDFKEFTQTSEKLTATELVSKINYCFKAFDEIIEKYKIEKIKTIGDAYMAAGGLPVLTEESVKNTVLAGLEMQSFIDKTKAELDIEKEISFEMRVGIHTGPVVAGIVGVKKFQYDIWGDTVNTASRMETNGEVGKVNISGDTYEIIKSDPSFSFESRGKIKVKGKGEINMYFVNLV